MAKISENDILNLSQDWGEDPSNGLPFSGRAVQKFIKDTFNSKMGYFYYDTSTNRYLVFADEEAKDKYLEDPSLRDLILGSFDAPFNFTASITLLSKQSNVLLKGSTGNYIEYTFDITDKSGASTMESIDVKYTFISGGLKKTVSAQYTYGTKVRFLVDDYLGEGETFIQIAITGQDTLAATTRAVAYRILDLTLSSSYNIGTVNDVRENPYIQIPFYVKSSRHVILKASIDYGAFETVMETDTYETNGAHQVNTSNLSEGKHSIRLQAQTIIDSITYSSDVVYKDFIVSRGTIADNLVLFEGTIPLGVEDTQFKLYGMQKYIPYNFTMAAYNPASSQSSVTISIITAGKEYSIGQKVLTNGNAETVTFTPLASGTSTLKVVNGNTVEEVPANVETSTIQVEEITNQLELSLRAIGRSNSDEDKTSWTYGSYSTVFNGFKWNARSGWVNNALKINAGASIDVNIAPLSFYPENAGFTFEMEFSTELVNDENTVVMDLTENGKGLKITASEVSMTSASGRSVATRFRPGDNIRVAFVIDNTPVRNSKLAYIYVNGVPSGVVDYLSTDNFSVSKTMSIGNTQDAIINISDIRIYRRALTAREILNNYILYQSALEEMLAIYNENDILTDGSIDYKKVANHIPVIIVTGDIPVLENTTNKKETINANIRYINLQNPELSFNMTNAQMTPQGTSSMYYPKKNFKIYTRKNDNTELRVGSDTFGEGDLVENKLYSFKEGAQPVDIWCLKADYAESSSTHNTGVARLWNDALTNMQVVVDGVSKYVGRTKAQQSAIENNYEYDVRTTIDGFPIVMFYHQTENDPLIFMGKYNFNNDKSTESVFGFRDIPGFDATNVECWEQLDSGNPYGLFTGDPSGFDANWDKAFEGRYPDGNTSTSKLKRLYNWVYSCKDNQSKFDAEWKQYLDPYKVAAYYVYLMRFGGVDQVAKNAMLTTEDGLIWFFINYDNDTIFGLDNDGLVSFNWDITRQTKIEGTEVYCYAGHDSALWNSLEGCTEFMQLVPVVDQALYSARKGTSDAGLSYGNVIDMFNEKQSAQWCETIYTEDSVYKYTNPYKNNSVNQLAKLQGRRSSHRAWWVQNRWNLFDGKWMTGEFQKEGMTFKCQQGDAGTTLNITAGNDMYYGIKVQTTMIQSQQLKKGESYDFAIDRPLQIGTPVSISNSSNVAGLDLSNFAANISSLDIQKAKNSAGESRLKKLVLGKTTADNNFLTTISGIESAYALQEIDITGFKGLTSLDLSQQVELVKVSARESGLRSIQLPEGAPINSLSLPSTLQSLKLVQLSELNSLGLGIASLQNLGEIKVIDTPQISSRFDWIFGWYTLKGVDNAECNVEMNQVSWTDVVAARLITLGSIITDGGKLVLKGKIVLQSATLDEIGQLKDIFGANVFTKGGDLWITAPDAMYLLGPTSIIEGDTAQFEAIALSSEEGTISYSITGGSKWNATIDSKTGLLTTTKTGGATGSMSVIARYVSASGITLAQQTLSLTVNMEVYPTNITIEGDPVLQGTRVYTWKTTTTGVNRTGTVQWSLSEELTPYATIMEQNDESCTVRVTDNTTMFVEGQIRLSLSYGSTTLNASFTVQILNEDIIMTNKTNPEVTYIMYKRGLANNSNFMTKVEAAAVTDTLLANISLSDWRDVKAFTEFKYFTGVTTIKSYMFSDCSSLTKIELPSSVISIGEDAFSGCTNLTEITIPGSVTSIGGWAFLNCTGLTEITIPNSVTSIGVAAFSRCARLAKIEVESGNTFYDSRDNCNCLIETASNVLMRGCKNSTIPGSVTSIGDHAFSRCTGLTEITIPNSVTSIGNSVFSDCTSLTEITIPGSVTSIGGWAFFNCTGLTEITIPNSVTSIGYSAFNQLLRVIIEEGTAVIPAGAFSQCSRLNYVKLPTGVTIAESSFAYTSALKSIEFPERVTIGNRAFQQSGLTSVTIHSGVTFASAAKDVFNSAKVETVIFEEGVEKIPESCFAACTSLTTVEFPSSLKEISSYAFNGCSKLSSVELPANNKIFTGVAVFQNCTSLTSIVIPEGIVSLGAWAFQGCTGLVSIDLPSTLTRFSTQDMSAATFSGCTAVQTITCRAMSAPWAGGEYDVFGLSAEAYTGRNNYDKGTNILYVPAGATGYDDPSGSAAFWANYLLDADSCGFTLSATL